MDNVNIGPPQLHVRGCLRCTYATKKPYLAPMSCFGRLEGVTLINGCFWLRCFGGSTPGGSQTNLRVCEFGIEAESVSVNNKTAKTTKIAATLDKLVSILKEKMIFYSRCHLL